MTRINGTQTAAIETGPGEPTPRMTWTARINDACDAYFRKCGLETRAEQMARAQVRDAYGRFA